MQFDYQAHNRRMVDRFIWLDTLDPDYARYALDQYRKDPNSPNPNILADVKTEIARRSTQPTSTSAHLSANTDLPAPRTTLARK